MELNRIGRALQLDGIENARNKVTLGFKTEAGTKIQLAREAQTYGLTLSEYVDVLVTQRNESNPNPEPVDSPELIAQNEDLKKMNQQILARLSKYENNSTLIQMFNENKGKAVSIKDSLGNEQKIVIEAISDVFTILVNSFKPTK